jgi:hypothetical protein
LRAVGCVSPGLCIELGEGRRAGSWTSPVHDCETGSAMGRVALDATPGCEAELRWGPTADTGAGWSGWTSVAALPEGTRVRFVQLRVRIPEGGECRGVRASWLPANRAPRVHAQVRARPRPGMPGFADPVYHVEAGDEDGDALRLQMRWTHTRSGWTHTSHPVALAAGVRGRHQAEVPADLPDGTYWVEAVVSDRPGNTPERAKEARWRGARAGLVVDRTRPVIAQVRVDAGEAVVTVTDATSRLAVVEYAVDHAAWTRAAAADGHIDSKRERFVLPVAPPGLTKGTHHVRIRATDARGNRVVTVAKFEVK